MRKFLLPLITVMFLCNCNSIKAQWVAIPDSFAKYIRLYVSPSAINGNLLDTTNTTVDSLTINMTISTSIKMNDISGIQYFKNLRNLAIYTGHIKNLPQLPDSLLTLEIWSDSLRTFSAPFGDSLQALKFYNVPFSTLQPLPPNLQKLSFNYSKIKTVPALPFFLNYLDVSYNDSLNTLPALPGSLVTLLGDYSPLTSLPALPFALQTLDIVSCNLLTGLPALPSSLLHLDIDNDIFTVFPSLPSSLQYLSASSTALPLPSFPAYLDTLFCNNCSNIANLPNAPYTLVYMDVQGSGVNTMGTMPTGMSALYLSNNPLTTVNLPDTIYTVLAMQNLSSLGGINLGVTGNLYMGSSYNYYYNGANLLLDNCPLAGNTIYNLLNHTYNLVPDNYQYSVIGISASNDGITAMPAFLASLNYLDISNNQIPDLSPQFTLPTNIGAINYPFDYNPIIKVSHNLLDSVNRLFFTQGTGAQSPQEVDLSYNSITGGVTWLPQTTRYTYPDSMGGGLYLGNNLITNITGPVYADTLDVSNNTGLNCLPYLFEAEALFTVGTNITCTPDEPQVNWYSDQGLAICLPGNPHHCPISSMTTGVTFNDSNQNGQMDTLEPFIPGIYLTMEPGNSLHISDTAGHYVFQCPPALPLTITALPTFPYRIVTTPPYLEYFNNFGLLDSMRNMGIYTIPNVNDMVVYLINYESFVRPGFHTQYFVDAFNQGTTTQNGNVVMYFDSSSLWLQSSNPPGVVTANSITWSISNLLPLRSFTASLDFIVPVPVQLGSRVNAGAWALCNANDTTPYNNHDSVSRIAVGSYDPNNKTVSPEGGLTQQQIAAGDYLTYTVHFQNTGTASAVNVRVEDTLSAALDLSSFNFITSSNDYTWSIDNRVLKVYFNNINLPDSGHNQAGSKGFFTYRIRPLTTDTVGQQIPNTAYIYFDFNPAVITDTTNTVISTYILSQPKSQVLCSGEPLLLYVKTTAAVVAVNWYKDGVSLGISGDTLLIDSTTALSGGIYTARIITTDGRVFSSLPAEVQVYDHSLLPSFNLVQGDTMKFCSNNTNIYITATVTNIAHLPGGALFNWYLNDSLIISGTTYFQRPLNLHNNDRLSCYVQSYCSNTSVGDSIIFVEYANPSPSINISPDTVRICGTQDVTFTATVLGYGTTPNISWYRNSVYIGSGLSRTIPSVSGTDIISCSVYVGGYVCYVNGQTVYVPVILDSTSLPYPGTLHITPSGTVFCPGVSGLFNTTSSNLGLNPVYQWSINGVATGTNTGTNTGTYNNGDVLQCKAISQVCNRPDTTTGSLVLMQDTAAPTASIVVTIPGSCTAYTYVNCINNLGGYLTYKWYRHGVLAAVVNNYSYFNFNRTLGVTDTLTCIVTSNSTCQTTPAQATIILSPMALPVYSTPYTITGSGSDTVCPASSYFFSANASGAHNYWYKNGILQPGYPYYTYTSTGDVSDFSVYSIIDRGDCGIRDTSNVLHVHIVQPGAVPQLQIGTIPEAYCAKTVQFTAQSNLGNMGSYVWYLNGSARVYGQVFSPNANVVVNQGDVLTCVYTATNVCGLPPETISQTLTVNYVNEKPVILLDTALANLCNTNTQTFVAQNTYGGSFPVFQWYKNGVQVGDSSSTYFDAGLNQGDLIYCRLLSDNPCALPSSATSDTLVINIQTPQYPTVSISTPQTNICAGVPATFVATPGVDGTAPVYHWQINGNAVGGTTDTFTYSTVNNGDVVSCILNATAGCLLQTTASSNGITMTISPPDTATLSISSAQTSICVGDNATFNATPVHGGALPVYQWQVNGLNVGSNSSSYSSNALNNGDAVTCILASSEGCVYPLQAVSNSINLTVNPNVIPSLTISPSQIGAICTGSNVTFTAIPGNGGLNPVYQWQLNGNNAGTNATYSSASLNNNDVVGCVLTSNAACVNPVNAQSSITVVVSSSIVPSINIAASLDTICAGTAVTFNAVPNGGGANPIYQWAINGHSTGTNSAQFISSALLNNDIVTCVLTSNASCANPINAGSNPITITVSPPLAFSVFINTAAGGACLGNNITFLANNSNGGSNPVYQWQVNGVNAGTNAPTYTSNTLHQGDIVTCQLTSSMNCASAIPAVSNADTVVIYSLPGAAVTLNGSSTFCAGDSTQLSAPAGNTYNWSTGASTQSIYAFATGTYRVTVTNGHNCSAISSATGIVVNALPNAVITHNGNVLSANTAVSYQWYLNGSPVNGATAQQLNATQNGQYEVLITDANGCKNMSAAFSVVSVGIQPVSNYSISLYPNPNTGAFILEFSDDVIREVEITDAIGRTILGGQKVSRKQTFNMDKAAAGVYFAHVKQDGAVKTLKFIVAK